MNNSNLQLWLAVLYISIGVIIGLLLVVLRVLYVKQNQHLSCQQNQVDKPNQEDQEDQEEQLLTEFQLAIIQCASNGAKGHRLVVELRNLGVLTNRETLRKAVNELRKSGYVV